MRLVCLFYLLSLGAAFAATVTGTRTTPSGTPDRTPIKFQLEVSKVTQTGGAVVSPTVVTVTPASDGTFSTNLIGGIYKVSSPTLPLTFSITMPSTNGTYDWLTLTTNVVTLIYSNVPLTFLYVTNLGGTGTNYFVSLTGSGTLATNIVGFNVDYVLNIPVLDLSPLTSYAQAVSNNVIVTSNSVVGSINTASNTVLSYATGVSNNPAFQFSSSGHAAVGFVGYDNSTTPLFTEVADAPSDGNYWGRQNGVWAVVPLVANATYYIMPTNSAVSGVRAMVNAVYPTKVTTSFAGLSGTYNLTNVLTTAGTPGVTFIPAGPYLFHIHAAQTGGTKSSVLYAEVWEADSSGGDLHKIGTTESTAALTGSEVEYQVVYVDGNVYAMTDANSRIKLKIYVIVSGGGSVPTVAISTGGTADSHLTLPSAPLDTSSYATVAALTGATNNNYTSATVYANTITNAGTTANTVYGTNVFWFTNAVNSSVTMNLGNGYCGYSTNGNIVIAGLNNVDSTLTKVQWETMIMTNTAGTTKTLTLPASWIGAVVCYITNQAVLSVVTYPGLGTNYLFRCVY